MPYQNNYEGMLDEYGIKLVTTKARQLVGRAGFSAMDRPDIEQELAMDLYLRMRHYNPAKGKSSTFMTCVVERHIGRLIEARQPSKRDWRMCQLSLNAPLEESDLPEQVDAMIDPVSVPAPERTNLRLDVKRTLEELPKELRELGELLLDIPLAEVAREIGLPRTTLYTRLAHLRKALSRAGLEKYL